MVTRVHPVPITEPQGSLAWQQWYLSLQFIKAHSDLEGVQGGSSPTQQYHLTAAEHAALTNATTGTWTPVFTSLTLGAPSTVTLTGRYQRIGKVVFWQVLITPTGGTTTASTAGTTYHTLPIAATQMDNSQASYVTTKIAIGIGHLDGTNSRNYPPTWAATANTIVLSGKYEV